VPKRHATRDDVAARAGVSSATVSYVVNNGPRPVAEATRARVLAAIAELSYHPDAVARSLRARRSRALGLVVPDNANLFFAELAHRLESAAALHGYSILLCNSQEDLENERKHLATLRDRRVDGIVLIPTDATGGYDHPWIDDIPVLALDRVPLGWRGDAVHTDGYAGGKLAVEHLLSLGHRRIGLIHGPPKLTHARDRLKGNLDALAALGEAHNRQYQDEGNFDYAGGWAAARALLALPERPTALCCGNDALAVGALALAHAAGLRVPDDVSIAGFDNVPIAAFTVPALTTIAQPYGDMATKAIELLLDRIESPGSEPEATPPRQHILDVALVTRKSTAPPR
jgi:LacI family transcriptional regulator